MSLAAETRDAVRARPFLYDALAAGVVNYAAAARELDVDGETDAITAALRRFAEELPAPDSGMAEATVRMKSGLDPVTGGAVDGEELLRVGDAGYDADTGSFTGVLATGGLDPRALERALARLRTQDVDVEAAGVAHGTLLVVVDRRDGADAVRLVEAAVAAE